MTIFSEYSNLKKKCFNRYHNTVSNRIAKCENFGPEKLIKKGDVAMTKWKALLCSMFMFAFVAWAAVASADDIVIGFTGPLSGPAAEYGQERADDLETGEIVEY